MTIYNTIKNTALTGLAALAIGITGGCAKDSGIREFSPESETVAENAIEVPEAPEINMSNAYVEVSASALMPTGSNVYNKGELAGGFSAGLTNRNGLELRLGADFFKSKANGKENGTEWSAESDYILPSVGVRKNSAKSHVARTYWGVELAELIANSKFKVGGDYDVNETDSSATLGVGFDAGINVGIMDVNLRYIILPRSPEVKGIVGLGLGCKF